MKKVLVLFLFLTASFNIAALDYLSVDNGLLFLLNSYEDSAPTSPYWSLGLTFPFADTDRSLVLDLGLLFFRTIYIYIPQEERAVPGEIEAANSLTAICMLLDFRVGYYFKIKKRFRLGGTIGLATVFRFPFIARDEGAKEYRGPSMRYLLSRFLYPEVELGFKVKIFDSLGFSFGFKTLIPFFHIWGGGKVPFYDQMIFNIVFGLQFYFKGRKTDELPEEEQTQEES